jgi:hypothetical protein
VDRTDENNRIALLALLEGRPDDGLRVRRNRERRRTVYTGE